MSGDTYIVTNDENDIAALREYYGDTISEVPGSGMYDGRRMFYVAGMSNEPAVMIFEGEE